MIQIHDLEYAFTVRGRIYAVQVCVYGQNAAPISPISSELTFVTSVPRELLVEEDHDPYVIARDSILAAQKYLPSTISEAEWEAFEEAIVAWVGSHRAEPTLRDHAV